MFQLVTKEMQIKATMTLPDIGASDDTQQPVFVGVGAGTTRRAC